MSESSERFLVVDDSGSTRQAVRAALEQMGYRSIDEATNGARAFEKLEKAVLSKKPYALVFCDIAMPEMDGMQLLDRVRAAPDLKDIPVIMITAESNKGTVIRAVMSGISGYIVKPFGIEEVKTKVAEIFQQVRQCPEPH